ncbi:MAG TPA: hypothetical protein PL124_02935 [Candidatus Cloacimonadota bacterium]|nr:hypothetical protein [Candidatus Cloacimonadota bacterium]HPS38347.1 hypothetical protein [Candidatus Cloacimonadota bacterium]
MRKSILILSLFLIMAISLMGTITYSAITKATVNKFEVQIGTTTVAVGDTANVYIVSPTFTEGYRISNKSIMVVGTVTAAIQHTVNTAQSKLKATLQVSADGSNWADWASFDPYMTSANTAGTVIMIPVSLQGVWAPYMRIKYTGYSALGVINVAKIFGTIATRIIIPPN